MTFDMKRFKQAVAAGLGMVFLVSCSPGQGGSSGQGNNSGFEVKVLVGSALGEFCDQAAEQFNQTNPKLASGEAFYMSCQAQGSGDVVTSVVNLADQLQKGLIQADAPEFPSLISVDGEIYQSQLIYRMEQLYPGQSYMPAITDTPLIANSPMVFMVPADLAPGLRKVDDLFKALVTAKTHQDLDPASPAQAIHYVHTAPTRSNSGLQTLVAQFASVSGKRPEALTVADVQAKQGEIAQIQAKITRYGISTHSLAQAMVTNGSFWASIGSVYESSVIEANSNLPPGATRYEAVYPKATFSSNMRAILPNAPWVSTSEKEAAEQIVTYLQSPEAQALVTQRGLRPGTPGIPLGPKFSAEFGVDPKAAYDSYRSPSPEVVEAMLKSWQDVAKKPSLVVIVVDSSGSMEGDKLPAVQNTLKAYIDSLGPKDQIALIDFDNDIRPPVLADSSPEGRDRGLQFISGLQANGGTRLYDSTLAAQQWLQQNLRPDAINAVLILTDGEDSGSATRLDMLTQQLKSSGFSSDQRIAFFTIGYGQEGEFNPQVLEQIAALNAGYYRKGDLSTINQVMADLQWEF
jgi:Ca-activated chloride channel homolog